MVWLSKMINILLWQILAFDSTCDLWAGDVSEFSSYYLISSLIDILIYKLYRDCYSSTTNIGVCDLIWLFWNKFSSSLWMLSAEWEDYFIIFETGLS